MIKIVPYNNEWPDEFRRLAARLRAELGGLALRIDHIGSTAVPGLPAKDRIDIQVTAAALTPEVEQAIVRAGYVRNLRIDGDHIPPGGSEDPAHWHKWIFGPVEGGRPVNLHARVAGNPNQRYPILFRDYLRTHPDSAAVYARVKQQLARYHADDIEAYCDIKDPVCDLIFFAAESWAEQTAWHPGPSDA
jgi:GrpB-like predicted nucleotidyltransferase (UPF0157 family)